MQQFIRFSLVVFVLLFQQKTNAQSANDYAKDWEAIQKATDQSLPKTALKLTEQLYQKIQQDKLNPQQAGLGIKALLYLNKYQSRLEEDGLIKAIYRFEQEAEAATFPAKPILQSMVAEMYDQYLQAHLYKFKDRTATEDFVQEDIRTWDISKITQKSYQLYQASIKNEATQKISIDQFEAIVNNGRDIEELRPTLYDFLAHRALDFFISDKYYLTKPSYQFYLDSEMDFAEAGSFVKRKLQAKDSLSASFQALVCFQKLLSFHLLEEDPSAYIDVELKRLDFVKNKSILKNKQALYLQSLGALKERYKKQPSSAEISHKIAFYYNQKGNSYTPSKGEENRWDLKKAYEICKAAIEQFPQSFGASNCKVLMNKISKRFMNVKTEKVNSIDLHILGLINYANLDKVYLKVIPVTKEQYTTFNKKYSAEKTNYLNRLKGAYKWSQQLKNEGDFQKHRLEFFIPALKNGQYILAVSADEEFSYGDNGISYSMFYVSDLAISSRRQNNNYEFYVTDRNNGKPLQDIKADFYVSKYNSLLRVYEKIKIHSSISDKDGFVSSQDYQKKKSYSHNNFTLKLSRKGEILYLDDNYYNRGPTLHYQRERTTFFLDRAIYRPGQTVYFKGMVIDQMSDGKNPELVKGEKRTIEFIDANYQSFSKLEVSTNEYGTFHGSFVAPNSGMMGQMQVKDGNNNSRKYFRVEEYKRPKFEVVALPVKKAYKIDDTVRVEGNAQAYAGSNIDGAKVQYIVYRQARFPYWNWRMYNPYSQRKQVITFGEATTDEKGHYTIDFKAIADKSIPKDRNPEFSYTVEATVTDITGETHSSTSSVRVGYIALDISMAIPEKVDKELATPFKINSRNLNYQYEASKGKIKIEWLKTPGTIYKKRYWPAPDYHLMDEKEFHKIFPDYAWKNKDKVRNWEVIKEVLSTDFDTEKSKELRIKNLRDWEQGHYKLTLNTEDKFGKPIEITKVFTLYGTNEKETPLNDALYLSKQNIYNVAPDSTVVIDFGSFSKNAWVLYEIEHDKKIVQKEWIQPKGRKQFSIYVEEKHRGNLHFHLTSIQNGRFYTKGGTVHVPWTNKDLKIEYASFRNKLYPGQKEAWKIKISGPKGDKVAAELLAGMYDASLDAFSANSWYLNVHQLNYSSISIDAKNNFQQVYSNLMQYNWNANIYGKTRDYKNLNWYGFSFYENGYYRGRRDRVDDMGSAITESEPMYEEMAEDEEKATTSANNIKNLATRKVGSTMATTVGVNQEKEGDDINSNESRAKSEDATEKEDFGDIKVRTNLEETVFFYPDLMTDEEGNVIIKFTMKEALTKWKFMLMAHTQTLQTAISIKEVVTQKDLMVMPNAPRFFRQNDEIYFTAKVSNMTDSLMKGNAKLQLFDAISMKPIDTEFGNTAATLPFEAKGKQSAPLVWKLNIPDGWTTAITHRVIAKAGNFSDGEESALPVLTNRMMVTETQPLPIRGKTTKKFVFKRLQEVSKSTTMRNHKLTLEFTQNPAWYAIQALPYLMEYPYECTEQIFSRYYANSLASNVANAYPKVKRVFDQWKNIDTEALKSNLAKNQELKYALLEETPWVLEAQSEEVQKKNMSVLFDLNKMGNELEKARDKMAERQLANGGFSWMPGGMHSWYITQYIVEGMGHLDKLKVKDIKEDPKMNTIINKALSFIDEELAIDYRKLLKRAKESKDEKKYLEEDHLGYMHMHYLYARTFFLDVEISNKTTRDAKEYYEGQAKKYWLNKSMYMQGMLALALHRKGTDTETPMKIVKSAKENSLNNNEMGMYWKYPSGYSWYELPIETHALMIELFEVVAQDEKAVEDLKVWLLKAKQTTHWKTTKATSAACYSLLMSGDNWLMDDQEIQITMGKKKLDQSKIKKETGTGYFKTTWEANEIKPEMAKIKVKNPNNVVAWGALYWQYFEDLNKITHFKETPLKLDKKLFKQINTDKGPVLQPIGNEKLVPGDLIKVRIELRVDRAMEYVHMKDMRASGLEPVNVLSGYKYQGGLGYYESTGDIATNFFFSYLSKGTYVFEYPLRVNHKGDFSNGVTTIQCMYAPEFTAHSEGIQITVH